MRFNDLYAYHKYIAGVASDRHDKGQVNVPQWKGLAFTKHGKNAAIATSGTRHGAPLVFPHGATLIFYEMYEVDDDANVKRLEYTFKYTSETLHFRYDKDPRPDVVKYPEHALCHLQVNVDTPRYITHETNFVEILDFIIASFKKGKGTNGK